jgi:CheY-like chemotaxis protein
MLLSYIPAAQQDTDILNILSQKWLAPGVHCQTFKRTPTESTALWVRPIIEDADSMLRRRMSAAKGLGGMHDTILIVDDDESTRTFLSTLLQGAGYGVVLADGLQAGMKVLEDTPVDLLIADVRLGGANGLQLIAMSRRFMPTIAITGFPDPVIEAQARQFGAMFLLKPFTSESLLALVEKQLRASAAHALLA